MNRATLLVLCAFSFSGVHAHTTSVTVSTEGDRPLASCDDVTIRFGDKKNPRATARGEQRLEGNPSALRAALPSEGHIQVLGWDQSHTSVLLCKAAGAGSEVAAKELLDEISASLDGGALSVHGPKGEEWVAYLLVHVPRRTAVDLEAQNGSIRVADLSGTVRARTVNGPVSLHDCTGKVDARAENGPIDFEGGGGRTSLAATNGPISVALTGERWDGEGLDARTENGPVSLKLSARYVSGIEVESSGHSPVSCTADPCDGARKTWDDDLRRITFGSAPTLVRLSTVNGPVSVDSPGKRRVRL